MSRTLYPILFLVAGGHLLNDLLQALVPAIYPLIKANFGYSFTLIGIINLVYQITSSILQPFVGQYVDKHKHPYILPFGMCFTLSGIVLLAYANNFGLILLAVALIGCGSSIFHPESAHLAQLASGGKKGLAQGIFQVGGYTGNAAGPLLAALIIIPFGQRSLSWFAVFALLAILLTVRVGRWYALQPPALNHQPSAAVGDHKFSKREINSALGILMFLIFTKYFYMTCLTSYYTFYLMDRFAVSVQTSQLFLFAFLAATAVGTICGGALGDKYGRKLVIWLSILGAAPFTIVMPYTGLWTTFVLAIIIGLIISSAFSAILVYATDLMPEKIALISGLFYGLMFGLSGLGSAILGWLADLTTIQTVFRITSFLPLLGIVAFKLPNLQRIK